MKPARKTFLYQLICNLYRVLFYVFFRGRILGSKIDIPKGGFIVMCNHIHLLDCVSMAIAVKGREPSFMAKAELFENRFVAALGRQVHAFPVHRGQMDLGAMRTSMQVLGRGEVLGIFPEGTRSKTGEMIPLQTGAAVLALKSKVPVIPMFIRGRYRLGGPLRVAVGRPIQVDDLRTVGADAETTERFLQRMRDAFASLAVKTLDRL